MRNIALAICLVLISTASHAAVPLVIKAQQRKIIHIDKKGIKKRHGIAASEFRCLARNIYFEARGESFMGQLAVGLVTLERAASEDFPSTICEVVNEEYAFSWTTENPKVHNQAAYNKAKYAADTALVIKSSGLDILKADHFHTLDIPKYPRWSRHLKPVAIIGNHVFYRSSNI